MNDTPQTQPPAQEGQEDKQVSINTQYIKDLSFENPGAPATLQIGSRPKIDISVDVQAKSIAEEAFEVALNISAKATRQEADEQGNPVGDVQTLFMLELTYGGVFTIKGLSQQELEPALLIFCPSLLFPYVRRIVSDATRDGGFPPLMLDPIDFARLYAQRQQQLAQQQAEAGAGTPPPAAE